MASPAQNERLTRVGPGTPMGELLRRYWHPFAAAAEIDDLGIKPVKLLGESLVAFRAGDGSYGLIDRQCPHRRADMAFGIIEEDGLRCSYHGWCFGASGQCLEQPYEDIANPKARFRDKIRTKAYPVEEKAGLLWAYMGPGPAPLVPNWEPFTWENGFRQVVYADVPCNWFQCQENSLDPVHFEWMHRNWTSRLSGDGSYGPKHLELKFDEFEFGHIYRRVREDTDKDSQHWTVGSTALWPNAFFLGDHIEWRVPVDDENTLSITWMFHRVPVGQEPYVQQRVPYWHGPVKDEQGNWITSHVLNQDIVAWAGQGAIADRTEEHLGQSDLGIVMLRRTFDENMKAVAEGRDPKGLIRDPERNKCVELPIKHREIFTTSMTLEESWELGRKLAYRFNQPHYPHQVGQPEEIKREFQVAMGMIAPDAEHTI
ncbi:MULTISPECIES: aromatic ring-hydroxylating dioxygenase subunit alpha [unclassified Sphingomonas]|uniref:aromatic ring-hydroxylating dioxygenase subunit alpha n=1 Tax=unclassified Sphingomonas TaxID=196159 RepID=UPI00092B03C3|nr:MULTISPECIES: aromatic ring-hydroxylating dioxygenase subunit alpha [unclassified Sphingomonas]MBN8850071.1 aromatic ring-hydroxylating dioxygenase subunit alpha [Sphingomonas sp.]OJV32885.1 MAG: phthalate 4,5-dioxygenase [Sphingomonas sp. 67-36]